MAGGFDMVARVLASKRGRAVCVRETFSLSPDPSPVFAMTPIRVVAEEVIQAVAYGIPGSGPEVLVRWNPLAREADELLPLAHALDDYLKDAVQRGVTPRVWVAHRAALAIVEMLGYRYRTNRQASEGIRRLGGQCAALFAEARRPGQQVFAIAGDLLRSHVVTGQSPAKDFHLRALLEWIDPLPGVDPAIAADQAAIQPAAAMLMRHYDDEVEDLRPVAKASGAKSDAARRRIEEILREGALQEWTLLESARDAYWGLNLLELPGWTPDQDRWRFSRIAEGRFWRPTRADGLSEAILDEEHAAEVLADREVRYDRLIREKARLAGRAVYCTVREVDQPKKGCKPCRLRLETTQEVMRVRRGTKLCSLDGSVEIQVESVEHEADQPIVIAALVTKGVRSATVPMEGQGIEFVDTAPFGGHYLKRNIYDAMRGHGHPLVFGGEIREAKQRDTDAGRLSAALDKLRES